MTNFINETFKTITDTPAFQLGLTDNMLNPKIQLVRNTINIDQLGKDCKYVVMHLFTPLRTNLATIIPTSRLFNTYQLYDQQKYFINLLSRLPIIVHYKGALYGTCYAQIVQSSKIGYEIDQTSKSLKTGYLPSNFWEFKTIDKDLKEWLQNKLIPRNVDPSNHFFYSSVYNDGTYLGMSDPQANNFVEMNNDVSANNKNSLLRALMQTCFQAMVYDTTSYYTLSNGALFVNCDSKTNIKCCGLYWSKPITTSPSTAAIFQSILTKISVDNEARKKIFDLVDCDFIIKSYGKSFTEYLKKLNINVGKASKDFLSWLRSQLGDYGDLLNQFQGLEYITPDFLKNLSQTTKTFDAFNFSSEITVTYNFKFENLMFLDISPTPLESFYQHLILTLQCASALPETEKPYFARFCSGMLGHSWDNFLRFFELEANSEKLDFELMKKCAVFMNIKKYAGSPLASYLTMLHDKETPNTLSAYNYIDFNHCMEKNYLSVREVMKRSITYSPREIPSAMFVATYQGTSVIIKTHCYRSYRHLLKTLSTRKERNILFDNLNTYGRQAMTVLDPYGIFMHYQKGNNVVSPIK